MQTFHRLAFILALGLSFGFLACGAAEAADDDDRKAKILANLKVQFPQLAELSVSMGSFEPSGFDGLERGSFTISGQRGPQIQQFLVSADDTQLFLISGDPIDVSKSQEEVALELAKQAEEKARQAAERVAEIEESIAGLPMRGNPDAPVTIVEFSDFQCPYCAKGAETMEQLLEKYPNDVKFVFKHYPLGFHKWAKPAAIASHCAAEQSDEAFWTLHDKYFEHQKEVNEGNVLAKSKEYLAGSGIDMAQWSTCAEDTSSEAYQQAAKVVNDDFSFGQRLGVTGTPGFFVNGQLLSGAKPVAAFEPLIAEAKQGS